MAKRKPALTHGLCIVDKPAGVTSHDVVGMLRKRFNERRVGHAGTLDPDATGVLVVAVGMTTKLLRFIEKTTKQYTGEVVFGTTTSTLDAAGDVTATFDMPHIDAATAQRVVDEHLVGQIEQIPPMVSAIRVDGRRLHELAREGIEIERQPRPVTIYSFNVSELANGPSSSPGENALSIDVSCSAGTYIRTLAADLGTLLGGGAHLRNLRRTAVGAFTLDQAAPPDECELLPVEAAVRDLTPVTVTADVQRLIANGRVLPSFDGAPPWAVFGPDGHVIAVYEPMDDDATNAARDAGPGSAKPAVVLPTAMIGSIEA